MSRQYHGSEIAIVGLSGRFPGAASPEALWRNVRHGVESIRQYSASELLAAGVDAELLRHPRYVRAGTVVDHFDRFDAGFFGYTPREAEVMDPQHRLFLQCAWEALEDAACPPETFAGLIGVFAGCAFQSYAVNNLSAHPELLTMVGEIGLAVGNERDGLASKVSYKLDLRGPSLTVQTFCSTSLVAVHLACQSLITLECDLALAGGVSIACPPGHGYLYQEGSILSPDGHCRAFDASAAGVVMGNGLGIVALKRLDAAMKNGDRIYAVICGTAINNDGIERVGYTAPGLRGQSAVITEALAVAGIEPETVAFVETHGTGTALGDSIEIAALKQVFGERAAEQSCALASVKTNIGHMDRASGVTGLIRASLALHHREIPPSLHFERANPNLDLEHGPFYVNAELKPWAASEHPRRAGVSSFGLGGTNAHAVLEEPPDREASGPSRVWHVLALSAKSKGALERATHNLREHLASSADLPFADIAYTLGVGRGSFNHRRIVVCRDHEHGIAALGGHHPDLVHDTQQHERNRSVTFVFPGVSEQAGPVTELYRDEPGFRRRLDALSQQIRDLTGADPRDCPAAFVVAVELALVGVLDDWGIQPAAVFGYGAGECTAACVAGVMSEEDAIRMAARRELSVDAVLQAPRIPWLSSVTGTWMSGRAAADREYWARQRRDDVDMAAGVGALLAERGDVLLEVGPGSAVAAIVPDAREGAREAAIISTLGRPSASETDDNARALVMALGRLWLAGVPVDWARLYAGERRHRVSLPTYSFEMDRFWIEPAGASSASSRGKNPMVEDWFYRPDWDWLDGLPDVSVKGQRWLLFLDERGVGGRIAKELRDRGAEVRAVSAGTTFETLTADSWRLDPASPDHYARLVEHLRSSAALPDHIVHLWGIDGSAATDAEVLLERGYYSVIGLVQAFSPHYVTDDLELVIVADGLHAVDGGDAPAPAKAALVGPARIVPQEYPRLRCRTIDVRADELTGEGARQASWSALLALLASTSVPVRSAAALRKGRGAVQVYRPLRLHAPDASATPLRHGGVYLITGALGRVGRILAEHLARLYHARLVLVGRTPLPAPPEWDSWIGTHDEADPIAARLLAVRRLEALGAEVLAVSADCSDAAAMTLAVKAARERFGRIDGVIHAATVSDAGASGMVQVLGREQSAPHFRAKLHALAALDRALTSESGDPGDEPDFVLLMSSLSAVLGGLGMAGYAAANACMDAFAAARAHRRPGSRWLAVGWDAWQRESDRKEAIGRTIAMFEMTPEEGVSAFERVVGATDVPHIVHSTGDLDARLDIWVPRVQAPAKARPAPAASDAAQRKPAAADGTDAIKAAIVSAWQRNLGIENIGRDDNYFDLGGSSLSAIQVAEDLQDALGVPISPMLLFEAPTVAELYRRLAPPDEIESDAPPAEPVAPAAANAGGGDIAIVGLACRFPGAPDEDALWRVLRDGVETVSFFSEDELIASGVTLAELRSPDYVPARGILEGVDLFDAGFFGLSAREAAYMDPQHRLFLECAWEALENAGYDPRRYRGRIGVFGGSNLSSYAMRLVQDPEASRWFSGLEAVIANERDSLATRVSYKLDLRGPSLTVQTFCSTSAVAVHLAMRSLLAGDAEMALAGGVSVHVPQKSGYLHDESYTSPDGHTRSFDARAAGTAFGEGVGLVVLKRLEDALADGDTIRAVIKGSAVNNDGAKKIGYHAPSADAQADAVWLALESAGVQPESIQLLEAHGTATVLGDPIEVAALTRAFRRGTEGRNFCALGSVKSNVGHLDRAAGVASLAKVILSLEHEAIPPVLHFERPNPRLDLAASPFYVNTDLRPWRAANGTPRRAAINSLGFGGTNVHMVLEEAPPRTGAPAPAWQVLVLSARSEAALNAATANLARHLHAHPEQDLGDVAYTLQVGRRVFDYRRIAVCRTSGEAVDVLQAAVGGESSHRREGAERGVSFLFPGFGDHYPGMADGIYRQEPLFREIVDECCRAIEPEIGFDLRSALFPADGGEGEPRDGQARLDLRSMVRGRGRARDRWLARTSTVHAAVFIVEYALGRLLMSWGLRPRALLGYSVGEYAAACLAGVMSLSDAVRLVVRRARLIEELPPGAMLAVPLAIDELTPLLGGELTVAIENGPMLHVVSGPREAVDTLEKTLAERDVASRRLDADHAAHSPAMAPIAGRFRDLVAGVTLSPPAIPYLSNVTGTWITESEATDPDYWVRHLCGAVRFGAGLDTLLAGDTVLLEVGPGQSLTSLVKQHPECPPERRLDALPTLRSSFNLQADRGFLLTTIGRLWLLGVDVDWPALHGGSRRRVALPTYPFERERYWLAPQTQAQPALSRADRYLQETTKQPLDDWFYVPDWRRVATDGRGKAAFIADSRGESAHALLERHEDVREALVVAHDDDFEHQLVAYVVPRELPPPAADLDRVETWPNGMRVAYQSRTESAHFYEDIFEKRIYQRHGIQLPDHACIFDVGANIGSFTLFAHHVCRHPQIYAFEPAPPLFARLRWNAAANGVAVRLFNVGVSDHSGLAQFTFYPQSSGMSSFHADKDEEKQVLRLMMERERDTVAGVDTLLGFADELLEERFRSEAFECPLRPLSAVIDECGVEWIDLLKIDVQKAELEVLNGLRDEHWPRVRQIVMEVHDLDGRLARIRDLLEARGFRVVVEQDELLVGSVLYNVFAVREDGAQPDHDARERQARAFFRATASVHASSLERHLTRHFEASVPADRRPAAVVTVRALPRDGKGEIDLAALPPPASVVVPDGRPWWIFADELGLGHEIAHRLHAAGEDVLIVSMGDRYLRHGDRKVTINPRRRADYDRLFAEHQTPRGVMHLWSVTGTEDGGEAGDVQDTIERRLDCGFYSALYLAQALGARADDERVGFMLIADRQQRVLEDDVVEPVKATLIGACKVLPLEIERLTCRTIDVSWPPDALAAAADLIVSEAQQPCGDQILAVRAGQLWARTYERRRLTAEDGGRSGLREHGVYLLTGGLGGIALAIADHLHRTVDARLVLVVRSPLPPREDWRRLIAAPDTSDDLRRKLSGVVDLEAAGAEVEVLAADVTSQPAIDAAVAAAVARFGRIDGVFHTAAVAAEGLAVRKTRSAAAAIMAPKIQGAVALDRALAAAGQTLDFFLSFSSTAAVTGGGPGQVDYAAANAFLDAYTAVPSRHGRVVSVAWGEWQWDNWSAGMEGFQPEARELYRRNRRQFGITFAEGMAALDRVLASGLPRVVVSSLDLERQLRGSETFTVETIFSVVDERRTEAARHARPVIGVAFAAASSEKERAVAAIWQHVLHLESVGVDDNFFDLGGTSLIGLQLVAEIKRELGVSLSPIAIYETPTVRTLARALDPEGEQAPESTVATALRQRRDAVRDSGDHAIAIVGMAGRFPGAPGVAQFWKNLVDGVESITFLSDEELRAAGVAAKDMADPAYVKAAAVIEGIEDFDAQLFDVSPWEAKVLDPQHRLFLECCWEALEHAGYNSERYAGLVGVFGGASISTYFINNLLRSKTEREPAVMLQAGISNTNDSLATRVSYRLNLKGPSMTVQTFCSTSAVAAHMACRSLLDGECDIALAGGVRIAVPHRVGYRYQAGSIDSADGHTRAFDARATGALAANGASVLVLKRLADALADGDTVYAVIKGSAINNDGSAKVGYTAPSVDGQVEAIRRALAMAGMPAETIDYVEAHGTGTEIGDPIEVTALTKAYRQETHARKFCGIGSLKANVGHMDRASGCAALIKMACAFHHGVLPGLVNFEQPNPKIDFDSSPFFVQAERRDWTRNGRPRRAAVNALGLGGTNVHFALEEAPERAPSDPDTRAQVIVLSAKTLPALERATDALATHLDTTPDVNLADAAFTLQVGRRRLDYRRLVVADDVTSARAALASRDPERLLTHRSQHAGKGVTLLFPGLGDHYVDMSAGLYAEEPVFRRTLDECAELLRPYLEADLRAVLFSGDRSEDARQGLDLRAMLQRAHGESEPSPLLRTKFAQPAVFAVEFALAQQWLAWGVRPAAMIGYSVGEYVAACLAGVMTLEDALCLVALRARMIDELPRSGMLAVPLCAAECASLVGDDLWIAAVNAPSVSVIGGTEEALARLGADLSTRGVESQRIAARHAFHTPMMDPVAHELEELASSIALRTPRVPFVSNVTGTWITAEECLDPSYWTRHLCRPVLFADGVATLEKEADRIYLEIGPGQSLGTLVRQNAAAGSLLTIVASLRHAYLRRSDVSFLREALGRVWMAGVDVDWEAVHADRVRRRVPLPTYAFDRQRYWVEPAATNGRVDAPDEGKRQDIADWFYLPAFKASVPPMRETAHEPDAADWLVFSGGSSLENALVAALSADGCRVTVARIGEGFARHGEHEFTIDPRSPQDYVDLLNACDRTPRRMLHAWLLESDGRASDDAERFRRAQEIGLYSLISLSRAIGLRASSDPLEVMLLASGILAVTGVESIEPEKATALAVMRVLPQEYLHVGCRTLDVAIPAAGSAAEALQVDHLLAELLSPRRDLTVAYRGSRRFVETYEAVRLEPPSRPTLRRQGTYLLTGGLGGVALALARRLASEWQARLVLVGRTGLPPREVWADWGAAHAADDPTSRRIAAVTELEQLGGEVLVLAADVADEAALAEAVAAARERFGALHGVIHLAGILAPESFQPLSDTGPSECEWHFGPKAHGLSALARVLEHERLDFCALASSLSSILGGLGMVSYAAANLFMDAFVQRIHLQSSSTWISVNWDSWQLDAHQFDVIGRTLAAYEFTPDEGADAFERVIAHAGRMPQVIQSTGDLQARLEKWVYLDEARQFPTEPTGGHQRPDLATPFVAPESDVEKTIAGIWESLLQIEGVGARDSFFELGGHSLMGTRLFSRLRDTFGVQLPLRSLFESPTITQMADLIETLVWASGAQRESGERAKVASVEGEL